ncbi:Hypothetical predicted protein, partial [Paramuricea clavata]
IHEGLRYLTVSCNLVNPACYEMIYEPSGSTCLTSRGLTKVGQKLFQQFIEAFVYSVLGAQAKTRWSITDLRILVKPIPGFTAVASFGLAYLVSIEHDFKLGCQCRILAADLEGVKLDIAIMCRDIETKFLAAYNSRDSDSEQISELKHELLKEKEKCSQLEADISILVRGRNREINELKNTITCLENKLKSSDVINESLRQSLMQINSEKFNGVLSAEQSLSNQPEQINTYNCIIDTVKSIETANSNLGICLPGEPFIPETVSVESPLDNSCLIVQPASCNRNNNKLDNKCEINKVKLTEHNMNNDKISKAKVSRSYSRRNLNSPPYCEPLSLKSLGNLPLIEISKPCITQKKEPFLENPSNILNDSTTSTEMHVCIGQIPADISEFIVLDGDECMSECDNTNNCPFRQSFPERPPPLPHVRRAEWLAHLNLVRRLTAK